MQILPWGTDQILARTGDRETQLIYTSNRLAMKLYQADSIRQRLHQRIWQLMSSLWNESRLTAEIDETAGMLSNLVPGAEWNAFEQSVAALKQNIVARRSQLEVFVPDTSRAGDASRTGLNLRNSQHRNQCLNLQHGNDGQANNSWGCDKHPDQSWDILPMEGEWIRIRNQHHGKCLNLQAGFDFKETNVYSCNDHPDQTWRIVPLSDGRVQLINRNWQSCLSLQSGFNGSQTVGRSCNPNDASQAWILE